MGDLSLSGIGWASVFEAGEVPLITFTFVNVSEDVTETFTSSVYLSSDDILDANDLLVSQATLNGLAAGQSHTVFAEDPIPTDFPTGNYWWIAVCDSNNQVQETDETNNLVFQGDVAPELGPIRVVDLVPDHLSFQHPFGQIGGVVYTEARDGDGWRMTNDFNEITKSKLPAHKGHSHYHLGEDWVPEAGKAVGKEISAAADGEVVYSGFHEFFGNTVVIRHDVSDNETLDVEEVFSLYAHLDSRLVFADESNNDVSAGNVIGTLGSTGKGAQGAHLHLEIMSGDWEGYLAGNLGLFGYAEAPQAQWYDPTTFITESLKPPVFGEF
jgi:hypothetical protein